MLKKITGSLCIISALCMPGISYAYNFSNNLLDIWNKELAPYTTFNPDDQAVCVSDSTGKSLLSINEDKQVIPASVSKIYTEDFALAKLGPDYTYKTTIIRKDTTLYINGNLDPFFSDGDLQKVILFSNKKVGTKKIEHIIFTNLYINWSENQIQTKINLQRFIKKSSLFTKKADVTYKAFAYTGLGQKYTLTSAPLSVLLKQTNIFSTNSSSHALFMQLGGHDAFQKYMKETYGVGEDTVSFQTGSGLDGNTTTCGMTIRVLKHLHEYLIKNNIKVEDFLVFPGLDGGSMKHRMQTTAEETKLLVKPGFIYNHETLTGIMRTKDGFVYFGIFTTYPDTLDVKSARTFIDTFSEKMTHYFDTIPFNYRPFLYDQNSWTKVK
jgi:D-alanyl-D-alanine carboxypeptidase